MDRLEIFGILSALVLLSSLVVAAATNNTALDNARDKICNILEQFYYLLVYIASGVAAVMIVIMGLTWIASADNSKARTAAKMAVIHVIIGLLIVSIAVALVSIALPEGSNCIDHWV